MDDKRKTITGDDGIRTLCTVDVISCCSHRFNESSRIRRVRSISTSFLGEIPRRKRLSPPLGSLSALPCSGVEVRQAWVFKTWAARKAALSALARVLTLLLYCCCVTGRASRRRHARGQQEQ